MGTQRRGRKRGSEKHHHLWALVSWTDPQIFPRARCWGFPAKGRGGVDSLVASMGSAPSCPPCPGSAPIGVRRVFFRGHSPCIPALYPETSFPPPALGSVPAPSEHQQVLGDAQYSPMATLWGPTCTPRTPMGAQTPALPWAAGSWEERARDRLSPPAPWDSRVPPPQWLSSAVPGEVMGIPVTPSR